jgi:3-oxoacyl-[acyl-carrier protein] reductase
VRYPTFSTADGNAPIVLVTGGNRGIGFAIAQAFLQAGYTTIITSRNGQAPEGAQGMSCVKMDVSSEESVAEGFAEIEKTFGGVDVLVANAGITKDTLAMRMSDEDFTSVINTNLTGVFRTSKAAMKGMLKKRKGRMIFIGSVVGLLGSAGQTNYAATKAGLVGMARSLSRELGSRNITVNVVAPGFVDTDMTAILDESRKNEIINAVPLKRFSAPDEIAGVVRFLASDEAAYITVAVIPVDGGLGMGH